MKFWAEKGAWWAKNVSSKLETLQPSAVKNIFVIKHAAFGDMLLLRPFLITLRSAFPHAQITLSVISHYTQGIPEDLVDHIHVVPSTKEKAGLNKTLKKYREPGKQDLLFDLTASTRSLIQSLLTKSIIKIGFQHKGVHQLIFDIAIPRSIYQFEAETFLEQLRTLGINHEWPLQFKMDIPPVKRSRPYWVYFPSASHKDKSWPSECYHELIMAMAQKYSQYEHIILSGIAEWEKQLSKQIQKSLSELTNIKLFEASDKTVNLIKGATLLVCNDTGIRHLGTVLDTPTIGIFFSTQPFRYWPRFGMHQVVYNMDGSIPSCDQVRDTIEKVLEQKLS